MKIVVIGAGLIGAVHIQIVAQNGALAAIVDPSTDGAEMAQKYNVAHYVDLDDALNGNRFDGAIIATPNQLHFAHAQACIEHNLPCLVEKPLTDSVQTARRLVDLSGKAKVPILVGHHRRHNPLIQNAKAIIDKGELGRLVIANAMFCLYKPDDYYAPEWRRQAGAGPIFINLIHDIDLLRYLCGEVANVHAVQSNAMRGFEVEDTAAVLLQFENGALGTIGISDTAVAPWSWEFTAAENPAYPHVKTHSYTISGTHGSLSIPDLILWKQQQRSWWEPIQSQQIERSPAQSLERQFDHFCNVITGSQAPLVSAQEGYKNQLLLDQIISSAKLNTPLG